MIQKTQLSERLTTIRKAFDKQKKDKENAANKAVSSIRSILSLHILMQLAGCR